VFSEISGSPTVSKRVQCRASVLELASKQHGLVASYQINGEVLNSDRVHALTDTALFERIYPSVYRVLSSPTSFPQRALAAVLAVGRDAIAHSHTAGALLGLPNCPQPIRPQLLIPQSVRCRIEGVELRRRTHFPHDFVQRVDRVPTLCPAMTIIELQPTLGRQWSERAIDYALRTGLMSLSDLRSAVEFYAEASKKFYRIGSRLLAARQPTDIGLDSEWEAKVLRWIQRGRFPQPVLQHELVVQKRRRRLDFAYPDLKIAIEFDGFAFHNDRTTFDRDRAVENWLRLHGWLLLRFTATTKYADFVDQLRTAFAQRQI
jgi:very-short-patch-repair endonuclease